MDDSEGFMEEAARLQSDFPWKFEPETLELVAAPGTPGYDWYVDLERCTSSARVLDAIVQASTKAWMDDAMLGALVRRLDHLLDLQANVCSGGVDKEFDPKHHLSKRSAKG